jgi:hypothetical protein
MTVRVIISLMLVNADMLPEYITEEVFKQADV